MAGQSFSGGGASCDKGNMLSAARRDPLRLLVVRLVVDSRDLQRGMARHRADVVGPTVANLGDAAMPEAGELQLSREPRLIADAPVQLVHIVLGVRLPGPLIEDDQVGGVTAVNAADFGLKLGV